MRIILLKPGDEVLHAEAIKSLNDAVISLERSATLLADPTYLFVVAVDNADAIMGRVYGHVLHRFAQTDLLLYEVDVLPTYHRKGVGRAMLDYLKQMCIDRGYAEMWVLTEEDNVPARSLYERAGGQLEGSPTMMYVFYSGAGDHV